jgi:hypothetical protein
MEQHDACDRRHGDAGTSSPAQFQTANKSMVVLLFLPIGEPLLLCVSGMELFCSKINPFNEHFIVHQKWSYFVQIQNHHYSNLMMKMI